jgi:hypothetical protein
MNNSGYRAAGITVRALSIAFILNFTAACGSSSSKNVCAGNGTTTVASKVKNKVLGVQACAPIPEYDYLWLGEMVLSDLQKLPVKIIHITTTTDAEESQRHNLEKRTYAQVHIGEDIVVPAFGEASHWNRLELNRDVYSPQENRNFLMLRTYLNLPSLPPDSNGSGVANAKAAFLKLLERIAPKPGRNDAELNNIEIQIAMERLSEDKLEGLIVVSVQGTQTQVGTLNLRKEPLPAEVRRVERGSVETSQFRFQTTDGSTGEGGRSFQVFPK